MKGGPSASGPLSASWTRRPRRRGPNRRVRWEAASAERVTKQGAYVEEPVISPRRTGFARYPKWRVERVHGNGSVTGDQVSGAAGGRKGAAAGPEAGVRAGSCP